MGFVHSACGDDSALEHELVSLLRALKTGSTGLEADAGTWLVGNADDDGRHPVETSDSTPAAQLHGEVIGDFRLLRAIGKGAMGSVYEAEQLSVKRRVAVKLLQSWTASRDSRRRFIEESVTLAKLTHPGIAHVIAAGTRRLSLSGPDQALAAGIFNELHSVPWIAMELVENAQTILEWSRGQQPQEVIRIFASICDALHHGHQQGIIHRDLKPANILISDRSEPKIIDFGIARAIGVGSVAASSDTLPGLLLGSPRYMSPEQCEGSGSAIDTRSDVYSLGVVLYEALTGRMPYHVDETAIAACVRTVCQTPATDPRSAAPMLTKDIASVVLKALSKRPAERCQSASSFAADLRRVLAREPVAARRASWLHRGVLMLLRRPVASTLALIAMLGILTGIVGIGVGLARERTARIAADREAWLANLTAADSYLRDGNGGMAKKRLDAIPQSRRGWEWRLLSALSDTSVDEWQITSKHAGTFLSPSGRMAISQWRQDETAPWMADVYDVASRKLVRQFSDMHAAGRTEWSRDESRVIFARDTDFVIADPLTGTIVRTIQVPPGGSPLGLGLSPDGSMLVCGMTSPLGVIVFKTETGEILFQRQSAVWVFDAQFSPDGNTIAWCGDRGAEIVDTHTWKNIHTLAIPGAAQHEHGLVSFSPDGLTLALAFGRDVRLIDPVAGKVRAVLRGHAQRIHSVRFDESGSRLLTTSIDRTVRFWNVADGSPGPVLLGHETPTWAASFSADSTVAKPVIVSVDESNRLRLWEPDSGMPVFARRFDQCRESVRQLLFTRDGGTLFASGLGLCAAIAMSPSPRVHLSGGSSGLVNCGLPGGSVAVLRESGKAVVAESTLTGEQRWTWRSDEAAENILAGAAGRILAVVQAKATVLLDADDGRELCRINVDGKHTEGYAISDDGRLAATTALDGVLKVWDTASGKELERIPAKVDPSAGLCWSADGSWIVYCHAQDGVTVWDRASKRVISTMDSIGASVFSLALSPDKTRLAVGAKDRICHIFEIPSGTELLQLRDHVGTVISVAWSPDGRALATGGYDKCVIIHQIPSAK